LTILIFFSTIIFVTSKYSHGRVPACRQAGRNYVDLPVGRQARKDSKSMYYTYAIKSLRKNYIYVGLSNDYKRRVTEHNKGKSKTTNPYKPFKVILVEKFKTRAGARKREKYLKSGIGKEFLKKK